MTPWRGVLPLESFALRHGPPRWDGVMRIAIISDLHANFDALRALPRDYDRLWVLGDLVDYGPEPREVIDFVRAEAAIVVRGNHDHALGWREDPRCSPQYRDMAAATMAFTGQRLNASEKAYLATLPLTMECRIGTIKFFLCHATPSDPLFGYRTADSPGWEADLTGLGADVLIAGHTHVPFLRAASGGTIANPGSLGQPKTGDPAACYALWDDGAMQLRTFSYPFENTVKKLQRLGLDPAVTARLCTVLRTGGRLPSPTGLEKD
jgi:putative phosphoesterase